MRMCRPSVRLIAFVLCGVVFSGVFGSRGASFACAQESNFRVLFGEDPKDSENAKENLRLRPAEQTYYVFVENLSKQKQTVSIRLLTPKPPPDSDKITIEPGKVERVTFPKPAAPLDKTKLDEIPSSFKVQITAVERKPEEQTVQINMWRPWEYVQPPAVTFDGPRGTLEVNFTNAKPANRVHFDFQFPGLVNRDKITFVKEASVTGTGPLSLSAAGIQFAPDARTEAGSVFVDVDNYERAFVYEVALDRDRVNPGTRRSQPGVQLDCARYWKPEPYPVTIRVDNAPSDDRLGVRFDQAANQTFQERKSYSTPREQHIFFGLPDENGALTFNLKVSDWVWTIPLQGIRGGPTPRQIEAQLIENGAVVASDRKEMNVDDTPPEVTLLVPAPTRLIRGTRLLVKAKALDLESKVKGVYFFLGSPPPDRKGPPEADRIGGKYEAGDIWSAEIRLPDRESIVLTAAAVNGVDMPGFSEPAPLELITKQMAVALPPGPGAVSGVVMRGSRAQRNLDVELRDPKGATKLAAAKTDTAGAFRFDKIAPGSYQVYCRSSTSNSEDMQPVTVKAEEEAKIRLNLKVK